MIAQVFAILTLKKLTLEYLCIKGIHKHVFSKKKNTLIPVLTKMYMNISTYIHSYVYKYVH